MPLLSETHVLTRVSGDLKRKISGEEGAGQSGYNKKTRDSQRWVPERGENLITKATVL